MAKMTSGLQWAVRSCRHSPASGHRECNDIPRAPAQQLGVSQVQQDGMDKIDAALRVPGGLRGGGGTAGSPCMWDSAGSVTEAVRCTAGRSESPSVPNPHCF